MGSAHQVAPSSVPSHRPRERKIAYCVFAFCLIALPLLRHGFLRANTATFDEITHLQAGYRYWQCGEFANNPEHPPLVKLIAAAPIRKWKITGFPGACGTRVVQSRSMDSMIDAAIFSSPNFSQMLWKARSALIVFPLLLLVCVFFAVRSWFGDIAAAISALLITFEPTLLAHGALVTTDMAITALMFAAVWAAIEFARSPSLLVLGALALVLGLALASKHSAIPLPFFVLLTMLVTKRLSGNTRSASYGTIFLSWIAVCAVAVAILWAGYGFRYAALPHQTKPSYDLARWYASEHMEHSLVAKSVIFAGKHHLLPEAYLAGLTDIATYSSRSTYFFGKIYPTGFWYYFPAALAIKLTIGVLALFLAGIFAPPFWREHGRIVLPLLVPFGLFLAIAMAAKINIGVRHILPVIPFIIVIAAAVAATLIKQLDQVKQIKHSRALAAFPAALIVLSIASGLRAAPAQLSYANELFGGSDHLHYYLGDSNIDWGQSSDRLQAYVESQHFAGPNECAVASGVPWRKQTQCLELPSMVADMVRGKPAALVPETFTGALIIQPFAASWSSAYLPFLNHKPDEVHADGTILVYRGSFDLSQVAAVAHLNRGMFMLFVQHDAEHAAQELTAAQAHCPESDRERLQGLSALTLNILRQQREQH